MCGIAGLVDVGGGPPANLEARVNAMRHSLLHRGPDEQDSFFAEGVGLAATRLSIVDLAHGHQPMRSVDGRYVIVFNGEIYNYRALRDEIDYPFATHCDTEVVLAACIKWGPQALDRFNGMFAFCFWDTERRQGFLARDRAGVSPLAYRHKNGELLFASEVKALLPAISGARKLHVPSFVEWVVMPPWSGVEHSMFEDIEVLQPGCLMTFGRDGVSVRRWWDYKIDPLREGEYDPDELATKLRDTLAVAVGETHAQADVPVAAYLSGGIDSTSIVALTKVDSYTIRFEGMERYDYSKQRIIISDDSPFAAEAARAIGVNQHWVDVARAGILKDLPRIAAIADNMAPGEPEFALHYLARAASQKYKVVMVGDAADETNYGYHFILANESISSPEGPLRTFMQYGHRVKMLNPRIVAEMDPMQFLAAKYRAIAEEGGYGWGSRGDNIRTVSYLIFRRFLARLLHMGDLEGMAHSLEVRVPFADQRMLELTRRIPIELGFKDGVEKHLLRRAAPALMPDSIRWRKKSALPKDQGMDDLYRSEARKLLESPDPFVDAYLNVPHLRELASTTRGLEDIERYMLFQFLFAVHWSRHYDVS